MAVIGVIDIAMRADAQPLLLAVSKSGRALADLGKSAVGGGFAKIGEGIAAAAGAARHAAGELVSVKTAALGIAGAGLAAAAGLTALGASSLANIDRQGDLAEKLGVSGGALAAFEHAVKLTGGPTEALPEILGKLNSTLGQAATEATPATAALRRLGLEAKQLAAAGPIEATKAIADGLAKIENPAERAAVATRIFGEQGAKLAGTLGSGRAGIEALEAEARKLGLALADADYAKVAAANDAIDRAGAAIAGVGNQIAVALAPFIAAAGEKFAELAASGGGAGPAIAAGLKFAGAAVAIVADGAHYAKIGFLALQAGATATAAGIVGAFRLVAGALQSVINLLPGVEVNFARTIDNVSDDLNRLAADQIKGVGDAWREATPGDKVRGAFDSIANGAQNATAAVTDTRKALAGAGGALGDVAFKVGELETKLREQIATVGKSAAEIEVYKLAQAGAGRADLERVATLAKQLKTAEAAAKASEQLKADAKAVAESARSPLEKFEAERAKLAKMFSGGLIDAKTLDKATAAARRESGLDDVGKRAGALELGSAEARTALLNFRQQGQQSAEDASKKTAQNTAQIATAIAQVPTLLRKLLTAATGTTPEPVGI